MPKTRRGYAERVKPNPVIELETENDRIIKWRKERLRELGMSEEDATPISEKIESWHDIQDLINIGASPDQAAYCAYHNILARDLKHALKHGAPLEVAIALAD